MKKVLLSASILLLFINVSAQLLTWSPQFPNDNSTIVVTMDASKGNKGLQGFTGAVYMHLGVITSASTTNSDWKYVPTVWGSTTGPAATSLGGDKWSYTITNPRAYFNAALGGVPAGETILKVAILFRDGGGTKIQKNADNSDMYIPIYPAGSNNIIFTQPAITPTFNLLNETTNVTLGQSVSVTAVASSSSGTLKLYYKGAQIAGPLTATNTITGSGTVTTAGTQTFVAELTLGATSYYDTIQFYVPPVNVIADLPAGVKEGINFWPGCDSVTLVLYAPNKQNVVVIGDFAPNAWQPQSQYQMYKTTNENYYWITLRGLTPQVEYTFQYLVDNTIFIADPYSEKVLDPWNDKYIPVATYPGLKPYPTDPAVSAVNGFMSVFKTCETPYQWKVNNFIRPDKRNLVTYELLVRDFGDARNYQMLIDTISYFKRLGVNSIELMPVNEFSGNESWGYNPTFYCALDKAYGTKDKLKEFIDLCHENGIAVILDVVYNHLDAYNAPQGKLYWDGATGKPAVGNPWLNQSAPHPFSVFDDLNHSKAATQYLVKRALEYWIKEYRVDGYRFDLGKGFTQTVSTDATVDNIDYGRIGYLSGYYNYVINNVNPNTYMILEFMGTQRAEEQQYANKGFLLWSKCTIPYNEATMGWAATSDFSKVMYNSSQTAFSTPAAMGFMESHDEERLMYKNLQSGNSSGAYNVKTLATALDRQGAAAAVFFTTPGPKMLWQFGERGYDISRDFGGSNVANKPPHWEYMQDANRLKLYDVYSKLINLRTSNPNVFNSTNFNYDFYDNVGLFKRNQITDNAANGIKINVVANFDVVAQTRGNVGFQATGDWYNYVSNGTGSGLNGATNSTFNLSANNQSITLQPGEYHVYIYHPANVYIFNGSGYWNDAANWTYNKIPPATLPSGADIFINPKSGGECILDINQIIAPGANITVMAGKKIKIPLNLAVQ
jgi:glycosidase